MSRGLGDVARVLGVQGAEPVRRIGHPPNPAGETTETAAGAAVTHIPAERAVVTRKSDNGRYEISANIPIPAPAAKARRGYPWEELAVGESFFMPGGNKASNSSVTRANKLLAPRVFDGRLWTEKGVDGVRVWRMK